MEGIRWLFIHWQELLRSIAYSFTVIFLFIEGYEVLTDNNLIVNLFAFLALAFFPGIVFFFFDGLILSGYLKRQVNIPNPYSSTTITIKFGDIFQEAGWKAIGVNDFFDSLVDEDLVASRSLHGLTLNTFWPNNRGDWTKQINQHLRAKVANRERRSKGNQLRYPMGTTARAVTTSQKFLFVALGQTDISNNQTNATVETFVYSLRKLLSEARAACAMEPLVIPLMGSALARVGAKNSMLLDLIILATLEESRKGFITDNILIVLQSARSTEINLKSHQRSWTNG